MKWNWNKWEEQPLERRNTLQLFITSKCQCSCEGCFAEDWMNQCKKPYISKEQVRNILDDFEEKGGKQVNILGGEPLLHPEIGPILYYIKGRKFKVTLYTNGIGIDKFPSGTFDGIKIRQSIYTLKGEDKPVTSLSKNHEVEANFMVTRQTKLNEILLSAYHAEGEGCTVFFIYSFRDLNGKENPPQEFFCDDARQCMPVIHYKQLVHDFLEHYNGWMDIHISKRGVFESTKTLPDTKCRFVNVFSDNKIIQCPYDVTNEKYQNDYEFGTRNCQHNNTCLMSKIILKRKQ